MKTQFIISKGWELIKEYDFLIPAERGDTFVFNEIEYVIKAAIIDCDTNCKIYIINI